MTQILRGAVAIVTGSESGIGRAIATKLSEGGALVAGTYLSDEKGAKETQKGIRGKCLFSRCDVSDPDDVDAFYDGTNQELGVPTVLVNCAGVNGIGIRVCDMSLERWLAVLNVNLTGPFLMSRRFAKDLMGLRKPGKIVNITSIHEDIAVAGMAEYCASKGALRNLTRCLALELAPHIQVNNVAPGMILTEMNEEAVEHLDVRRERSEHIPLHRPGKPEDVAELVLFLVSPKSSYATGTTFFLDGGLSLNLGQGA